MWKNLLHHPPKSFSSINASAISKVEETLNDLKVSHQHLDRLINLETWAIVATMDDLFPGFWHQFMNNRQIALKNVVQQQKHLAKDS